MTFSLKFPQKKAEFKKFLFHALHQIQNSVQLIRVKWDLSEEGSNKDYIDAIKKQLKYLSLYLSKLSNTYDASSPYVIVDIVSLVKKICYEFTPIHSHKVSCSYPRKIVLVKTRNFLLQEAIRMILENALKYTPKGERISLRLSNDEDFIVISLKNTGVGIESSEYEKILEENYRAKKDGYGLGIGLYVTNRIIKLHKGFIKINSDGTSFFEINIHLPIVKR